MSFLEASNASYAYRNHYQTVRAVNDVSFAFETGKFYAIIGKSGSGKTTLLSLLAGLDLPTEGEVRYCGAPTGTLNTDEYRRDHVAVIYQNYNLFPQMTVLENVMIPLLLKKVKKTEARDKATEQLLNIGLREDMFSRYPNMLSGGEQQRVAIARSLVGGHGIILADEPTGNLDTENGTAIINMLAKLAHEHNILVIVVTHDPEVSARADVVLQMRDGWLFDAE
jgi:putative ABC transport system ATP-binding protein